MNAKPFQSTVSIGDSGNGLSLAEGSVDIQAGTIKGVSIATANVEAIGHGTYDEDDNLIAELWTDSTTLEQILECVKDLGQPLKAKLEHETGIAEIIGDFDNFRIDGEHLRADFTAYETSQLGRHVVQLSARLYKQFGVSIHAILSRVKGAGVDLMRCSKVFSADFVERPAINAALFSATKELDNYAKDDKAKFMDNEQLQALIQEAILPLAEKITAIEASMMKPSKELAAEETAQKEMSDKLMETENQLSQLKLTVEEQGKKLAAAEAKAKELGTTLAASISQLPVEKKTANTFDAAMSEKQKAGKSYAASLSELRKESVEILEAEAKRRGLPSINSL